MVFSTVIVRVSKDRNPTTTSTTHDISRVSRRVNYVSGAGGMGMGASSTANVGVRSEGVQITLDTVTHRDPSEFELDKIEAGVSPYDHHKPRVL